MKLDTKIPHVLNANVVVEGEAFNLQEVLVVETDLAVTSLDRDFNEEAFSALSTSLVELMKANPRIDRLRVERIHA